MARSPEHETLEHAVARGLVERELAARLLERCGGDARAVLAALRPRLAPEVVAELTAFYRRAGAKSSWGAVPTLSLSGSGSDRLAPPSPPSSSSDRLATLNLSGSGSGSDRLATLNLSGSGSDRLAPPSPPSSSSDRLATLNLSGSGSGSDRLATLNLSGSGSDRLVPPSLSTSASSARLAPQGPRQVGPYVIERELARGGMGVVSIAGHEETGRRVALKRLQRAQGVARAAWSGLPDAEEARYLALGAWSAAHEALADEDLQRRAAALRVQGWFHYPVARLRYAPDEVCSSSDALFLDEEHLLVCGRERQGGGVARWAWRERAPAATWPWPGTRTLALGPGVLWISRWRGELERARGFDPAAPDPPAPVRVLDGRRRALAVAPDGTAAIGGDDETEGSMPALVSVAGEVTALPDDPARPWRTTHRAAAFSPEGRWIAFGGGDVPDPRRQSTAPPDLAIWETERRRLAFHVAPSAAVQALLFLRDGTLFAACEGGRVLRYPRADETWREELPIEVDVPVRGEIGVQVRAWPARPPSAGSTWAAATAATATSPCSTCSTCAPRSRASTSPGATPPGSRSRRSTSRLGAATRCAGPGAARSWCSPATTTPPEWREDAPLQAGR
ncbi:MAG: hypothetical protein AB7N76_15120 [Planctomycetota bacterium]